MKNTIENKEKPCTIPSVRSCFTCVENKGKGKESICCHCSGNLDMYEPKVI